MTQKMGHPALSPMTHPPTITFKKGVRVGRRPRALAESGYYHITMRGNGKQILFEDAADHKVFLDYLSDALDKSRVDLHAWCLMSNHAHLVATDTENELSTVMRSLCARFAMRFNRSNGHVGHVFEGRFESFPIENETYLLRAVRYVHNNPVAAGICTTPDGYRWSSYGEYVGTPWLTDTLTVLDMLGGVEGFMSFSTQQEETGYRPERPRRMSDDEALIAAREALGPTEPHQVKALDRERRDACLRALRAAGLSRAQIQRLTGIGERTITRACKGHR